jgi:2-dehydro-3-deoxyphosphooctonate aldolase (KDO 8-P synthase)
MKPDSPFFLVSGPCVIEDEAVTLRIATRLKELTDSLGIPFTFKASYDKANRTAITSFRGPGMTDGLGTCWPSIKETLDVPLLIGCSPHQRRGRRPRRCLTSSRSRPFFAARPTCSWRWQRPVRPVNVKKGQFLAPWDMVNIVDKIRSVSSVQPMITERGVMFGYNNLVVDFRGIQIMQQTGCPVDLRRHP